MRSVLPRAKSRALCGPFRYMRPLGYVSDLPEHEIECFCIGHFLVRVRLAKQAYYGGTINASQVLMIPAHQLRMDCDDPLHPIDGSRPRKPESDVSEHHRVDHRLIRINRRDQLARKRRFDSSGRAVEQPECFGEAEP